MILSSLRDWEIRLLRKKLIDATKWRIFVTNVIMDLAKISTVSEPAVSYSAQSDRYNHLLTLLGGTKTIKSKVHNELDLILLTRAGLPKKSLDTLSAKLGISMERLSRLLNISLRTLQRKKDTDHLSIHVSEQILAIAEVVIRGIEVLGSQQSLEIWLHSQLASINNRKPIDIMDTTIGTQLLLKILGRIEHGVY